MIKPIIRNIIVFGIAGFFGLIVYGLIKLMILFQITIIYLFNIFYDL